MTSRQAVSRVRRSYNQWVADETLEDYALRFTAKRARRWSGLRVAGTALGAISFLALEAIGGAITLQYGFANAVAAILLASLVILLTAIPISYYAARYGVDSDLLTRGAGFGYLGSTITSLVYASFTFLFFALEAVILAMALELLFGMPLWLGYLLSALVVIPLVVFGITLISRFQIWTQPFWILLQLLPFVFILYLDARTVEDWTRFVGPVTAESGAGGFDLLLFGAAAAVIFSLVAQIGEQVDFLRFVPEARPGRRLRWWVAVMAGGPGWIVIGVLKLLLGSFLAVLALGHGLSVAEAADPTHMYMVAFGYVTQSPQAALAMAGIFVILSQVKINVTNAYAGSIAWSNFFSRLTHRHPGRVVWLVFNVCIALLVMELGVYRALEATLGHYGIVAISWAGALVADLVINKPLGLSPPHIEFRRAHLYDVNPVGVGAMLLAILIGMSAYLGTFGEVPAALAHFISLGVALLVAPIIAWVTGGRYYLARPVVAVPVAADGQAVCCICANRFDQEDMTHCPAYAGTICSLCCSLDSRCGDVCKPGAAYDDQMQTFLRWLLPRKFERQMHGGLAQFLFVLLLINALIGAMLTFIHHQGSIGDPPIDALLAATLWKVFFVLVIITGVLSWLFVLANESRRVAQEESSRQNRLLLDEVDAHETTDRALQEAKERAEAANQAKSRYLTGISHELRSPLNAVLGYAQLLEKDPQIPTERRPALAVIRRSGEYLADLIEGLLDLSKIEAGRLELQYREVRMDLLLDQLVHMFRLQAQEKGLEFQFVYADRVPRWVRADEKRVRQILINLLTNAIKYTDRGWVRFTVGYHGSVAEFTVEDSGEGIASSDLERIFLPFERVRRSGSGATGTGLGLTITKLLCEIMGGEISVQSRLGQGSTFRVALLLSSLRALHEDPESEEGGCLPKGYHGRRRRILVVDDETVHRQLMVELLVPMGFAVTTLPDGDQVEAWLQDHAVDLILLDVNMPGRDGCVLLRALRGAGCRVPVVILSASAANAATPVGAGEDTEVPRLHDGYFTKPLPLDALLEHIGQLLRLDWLYSDPLAPVESDTGGGFPLARLDAARRCELMEMLRIGHRTGVMKLLYRMRDEDPERADSFLKMIHMAENLQFAALMALLEEGTDESA
jgi:signal transduction histidine kinase/CheY-like chemotaxis protein/purine-cytosine permease-like protein